jgi:Tfp pilus assembly protein PilN
MSSGLIVMAVASLALGGWLWRDTAEMEEAAVHYRGATERLQRHAPPLAADVMLVGAERMPGSTAERLRVASRLRELQGLSWTDLLSDLEEAIPEEVSLTAVEPSASGEHIGLSGSAGSVEVLARFAGILERHDRFHDVAISQHTLKARERDRTATEPDASGPIDFRLTVRYAGH